MDDVHPFDQTEDYNRIIQKVGITIEEEAKTKAVEIIANINDQVNIYTNGVKENITSLINFETLIINDEKIKSNIADLNVDFPCPINITLLEFPIFSAQKVKHFFLLALQNSSMVIFWSAECRLALLYQISIYSKISNSIF